MQNIRRDIESEVPLESVSLLFSTIGQELSQLQESDEEKLSFGSNSPGFCEIRLFLKMLGHHTKFTCKAAKFLLALSFSDFPFPSSNEIGYLKTHDGLLQAIGCHNFLSIED